MLLGRVLSTPWTRPVRVFQLKSGRFVSAVRVVLPVPDTASTGPRVVSSKPSVLSVPGTGMAGALDATFLLEMF